MCKLTSLTGKVTVRNLQFSRLWDNGVVTVADCGMNYRGSIHCKVRRFSLCHHRHLHTGYEAIQSLGTQCSAAGA